MCGISLKVASMSFRIDSGAGMLSPMFSETPQNCAKSASWGHERPATALHAEHAGIGLKGERPYQHAAQPEEACFPDSFDDRARKGIRGRESGSSEGADKRLAALEACFQAGKAIDTVADASAIKHY
jgi:hypothetical protein